MSKLHKADFVLGENIWIQYTPYLEIIDIDWIYICRSLDIIPYVS